MSVLHLVDGHGYIHRAYHASAGRGPRAALATFAQMVDRLERDHRVQRGAVVLDAGGRTWRHELFPSYKAHRPAPDRELLEQLPAFGPLARALGWPVVQVPGYEADDVIATLVTRARGRGWRAIRLHASDKDLLGLVGDDCLMTDAVRRVEFGVAEVVAKLGVGPDRVADLLALRGDDGDGVPGIEGCGDKTAADLVRRHATLDDVIAANPKIRGKYPLATAEGVATLRLSRRLVELATDVPVDLELEQLAIGRRDEAVVRELLAPPRPPEQLGLGGIPQPAAPPAPTTPPPPIASFQGGGGGRRSLREAARPRPVDAGPQPMRGEQLERYQERAAIREYLGGLDRTEAERLALVDVGHVRQPDRKESAHG